MRVHYNEIKNEIAYFCDVHLKIDNIVSVHRRIQEFDPVLNT